MKNEQKHLSGTKEQLLELTYVRERNMALLQRVHFCQSLLALALLTLGTR